MRFDAVVEFEDTPTTVAEPFVGPRANPLAGTRVLSVRKCGTFIGFEGEREVRFTSGGWCVQRHVSASAGSEGTLRFWLDCTSGARKGDISIAPGERIFFTTGVWDDADELQRLIRHRDAMEAKLKESNAVLDSKANGSAGPYALSEGIPGLGSIASFHKRMVAYDERLS